MSFLTGSHMYGEVREDSDIDLVILMPIGPGLDALIANATGVCTTHKYNDTDGLTILRYGDLNLIICHSEEDYDKWKLATQRALDRKNTVGRNLNKDEYLPIFRYTLYGEGKWKI